MFAAASTRWFNRGCHPLLECVPLAGRVDIHVLIGGLTILEIADGNGLAVSALVELQFEVGKVWNSFIIVLAVKRFLLAWDAVLESETLNKLPMADRRTVEAAAYVLGLSVDEIQEKFRCGTQQEHVESYVDSREVTSENAKQEEMEIMTDVVSIGEGVGSVDLDGP